MRPQRSWPARRPPPSSAAPEPWAALQADGILFVAYAIGSAVALLSLGTAEPPDGPLTFGGGFDGSGGIDGL